MSKISIKTDFKNGEKLFDTDLNNNFKVIQAGVNANEENLQEVIDEAIVRLDAELEAITADRGWDWNGGDRVTFYKGNTSAINNREIVNGQMLYNTDTGETALDDNGERIITGSGNVVSVGETQPTNPATKLWIDPRKMVKYGASYVIDSMEGTDKDKSPSVNAVKEYVIGTVIESGSNENGSYIKYADGTLICRGMANITVPITYSGYYGFCRLTQEYTPTFPYEFVDNQYNITLTSDTFGYFSAIVTGMTASTFSFRGCTHNQSDYNPGAGKFHYIAIGRWK